MGDGEERAPCAQRVESSPRAAVKLQPRRPAAAYDLDAAPQDVLGVSCAECLHRGFLRGEASGKMNGRLAPSHAVRDLAFREDPLNEAVAVAVDGRHDARDVCGIDAEADDGGHNSMILPTPGRGFAWRPTRFGPALVCLPLEDVAPHVFTTRLWELGDEPEHPDIWAKAAEAIGLPANDLVKMKQVHGQAVTRAARATALERREADIALSDDANLGVAVQAADCVPLLIADRRLGVVAAAHAGWRGLAQRVPFKTVRALAAAFGSHPADLIAAVGPSVGACCYEVGRDVRIACETHADGADDWRCWFEPARRDMPGNASMPGLPATPREDHAFFDGWAAAHDQLIAAGMPGAAIFSAALCTASHPDLFWSYRREGRRAKRLVGAIRPVAAGAHASMDR